MSRAACGKYVNPKSGRPECINQYCRGDCVMNNSGDCLCRPFGRTSNQTNLYHGAGRFDETNRPQATPDGFIDWEQKQTICAICNEHFLGEAHPGHSSPEAEDQQQQEDSSSEEEFDSDIWMDASE